MGCAYRLPPRRSTTRKVSTTRRLRMSRMTALIETHILIVSHDVQSLTDALSMMVKGANGCSLSADSILDVHLAFFGHHFAKRVVGCARVFSPTLS